jgi:hypothetical protein
MLFSRIRRKPKIKDFLTLGHGNRIRKILSSYSPNKLNAKYTTLVTLIIVILKLFLAQSTFDF